MDQRDFRMPATGEEWRHYKGGLYAIVGMARDDKGDAIVVYSDYEWRDGDPLYVQPLGRFLQEIENDKPRFKFERAKR